jgi:hypothetical protein
MKKKSEAQPEPLLKLFFYYKKKTKKFIFKNFFLVSSSCFKISILTRFQNNQLRAHKISSQGSNLLKYTNLNCLLQK